MKNSSILVSFCLLLSGCTIFESLENDDEPVKMSADVGMDMAPGDASVDMVSLPDLPDMTIPLTGVWKEISAGDQHGCALTHKGEAYCWGNNDDGRLGIGNEDPMNRPTLVSGGFTFDSIDANRGTCAINTEGKLYCWGNINYIGIDGDAALIPTQTGPSGVVFRKVAVGLQHVCALSDDNEVWCAGRGEVGQLGNLTDEDTHSYQKIEGFLASDIASGEDYSCAISNDEIFCWGVDFPDNTSSRTHSSTPIPVPSSFVPVSLSGGEDHVCGLTERGEVFCWGNETFMDSLRTEPARSVPGRVDPLFEYLQISSGDGFVCGIRKESLQVVCWGSNYRGTLGVGSDDPSPSSVFPPSSVGRAGSYRSVEVGDRLSCAIDQDGSSFCWGHNEYGQVGIGVDGESAPAAVKTGLKFTSVDVGWFNTCGIAEDSFTYCWGRGSYNGLGTGQVTHELFPKAVGIKATTLVSAATRTCVIGDEGTFCWGLDTDGSLGVGDLYHQPTPAKLEIDFRDIQIGRYSSCGVDANNHGWCWGDASELRGQFTTDAESPVRLDMAHQGYLTVAPALTHICGLKTTGSISCWGRNAYGALGDGTTSDSILPVNVQSGVKFRSVTTGSYTTCAVSVSDAGYCWGYGPRSGNEGGNQLLPAELPGDLSWKEISAHEDYTCGVTLGGDVYCWGRQLWNRLGTNTTNDELVPVKIEGLPIMDTVSVGLDHTCALSSEGDVFCWGKRSFGVLGDGVDAIVNTPTPMDISEVN